MFRVENYNFTGTIEDVVYKLRKDAQKLGKFLFKDIKTK